jgi:hypothetical protein
METVDVGCVRGLGQWLQVGLVDFQKMERYLELCKIKLGD